MSEHIQFLPIKDTVIFAWQKLKGAKYAIWAAIGLSFLILGSFRVIELTTNNHTSNGLLFLLSIIEGAVQYLLIGGTNYLGILRARGVTLSYRMMSRAFQSDIAAKALGLCLLKSFILVAIAFAAMLINIVFFLALTPAIIYLMFRMSMALPLVLDKGLYPWQAITQSFEMTRWNFWRLVALYFLQIGLFLLSLATLGIGFIWTMPLLVVIYGTVYNSLLPNLRQQRNPLATFEYAKSSRADFI